MPCPNPATSVGNTTGYQRPSANWAAFLALGQAGTRAPLTVEAGCPMIDSKTNSYIARQKRDAMPPRRISRTITFSLPPDMFEEVQRVKEEEGRDMSELVREALRLYMEDRELRRQQRLERLRSRRAGQDEPQGGETDE